MRAVVGVLASAYTKINRTAPAEADIECFFRVSAPFRPRRRFEA